MKYLTLILCLIGFSFLFAQNKTLSTYVFYFNTAEYQQVKDSSDQFNVFYKSYENCLSCRFYLEGFADKEGSSKVNFKLAQNRINYVKGLLNVKDSTQISEKVYGEKLSQKAKENLYFRKVILKIEQDGSVEKNASLTEKKDALVSVDMKKINDPFFSSEKDPDKIKEKRYREFDVRENPIRLNILFRLNTTELIPESYDDLKILKDYLDDHPTLNAKLTGHVCCQNDQQLSHNRAYQIYFYLYKQGIDRKRLSHEGHGNTEPFVKEVSEATQQINRRVEVFFYE